MLGTSSEGNRESLRTSDSASVVATPVRKITGGEAVDSGLALVWVELGGIFQVSHPAFVHLLGDPAFVADVGVPVTLVECDDDTLDVGRAIAGWCQPGAVGLMLGDVG